MLRTEHLFEKRAIVRTLTEDPKANASSRLARPLTFAAQRMLIAEPRLVRSITERFKTEPAITRPMTEAHDPTRAKERTDMTDPIVLKLSTETLEPNLAQVRSEQALPQLTISNTERVLPILPPRRKDKADPRTTKDIEDMLAPVLAPCLTEMVDPRAQKLTTEA
jgi:hypothetical protein